MHLFHRHQNNQVVAPVDGQLQPISAVADPVFASKAVGDGFAVKPADGQIYAPIFGRVDSVFPTKHALSLKMDSGVSVLVHMGIDTVDLNGQGFVIHVKAGQRVKPDTLLAEVDLNYLAAQQKDSVIMTIFPELGKPVPSVHEGAVAHGQEVFTLD